jgi:hypothetical protein
MKKQIEKINKEDVKGYEKLVNFTKKIFDKGLQNLLMFHLINLLYDATTTSFIKT